MAKNVTVNVIGSTPKVMEVTSARDAMSKLGLSGNYTATANGSAVDLDAGLQDFTFLTLAVAIKGGK